jgi:two-component system alkaline phosphatase synthesis response regulator PhoP
MAKESIFIIEDDKNILEVLRFNLAKERYRVDYSEDGETGLLKIASKTPDLILLDLMLPGIDGLEVCRRLKTNEKTNSISIVMLTAKGEEADIVAGLELGADDYITKPFSTRVLLARIRTVLRRKSAAATTDEGVLKIHNLVIHPGKHQVLVDGNEVELTRTEFSLIHFLAKRKGWVFTRNQIIDVVQGEDYPVTDRSVDVQIVGLRKKLGAAGEYIETIRGVGYKFKD